jgi:hypothetical protein
MLFNKTFLTSKKKKKKKKTMVVQSSSEAEYKAMTHTTSELTWLQHFLQEIGFSTPTRIPLFCDN